MKDFRHRYPRAALWAAGGLVVAAVTWLLVAVPMLVKYPTDLDVSPRYEGTFTLLVDPATAAPLDEPVVVPLEIERHLEAIGEESGSSRVLVRETIVQRAGDLVDTTQTNAYVMDRSTLENVADDRAFAFDADNVVDRSGAFRLNLPFGTSRDETYDIYKNEIDDTYEMRADTETPTVTLEGLDLSNFVATVEEAPLSEAYLAELGRSVPLPESLTLDQLAPQLEAVGIDVAAVLAALGPVLTEEDAAVLAGFASEPIGLDYVLSFEGRAAVEPTTGAEVRVAAAESVGARPQLTTLPALLEVLGHYPDVPEAVGAIEGLDALASGPATPLFSFEYTQTPASVADIADEVASMRTQVLLAQRWLPMGLAAAAFLALVVGSGVAWRRARPEVPAPVAPAMEEIRIPTATGTGVAPEERPLIGTGSDGSR